MSLIQTQEPNYSRNISSKALINTNKAARNEFLVKRDSRRQVEQLASSVEKLNADVEEIKGMLKALANG